MPGWLRSVWRPPLIRGGFLGAAAILSVYFVCLLNLLQICNSRDASNSNSRAMFCFVLYCTITGTKTRPECKMEAYTPTSRALKLESESELDWKWEWNCDSFAKWKRMETRDRMLSLEEGTNPHLAGCSTKAPNGSNYASTNGAYQTPQTAILERASPALDLALAREWPD